MWQNKAERKPSGDPLDRLLTNDVLPPLHKDTHHLIDVKPEVQQRHD